MFDPHACNLPGISPTHPGLRIKFAGRKILEQFPDQFSPFLHFGCDLQRPFPGTLFRFALRSANAASRSQIKKEVYAPSDVLSLFSSFSEVVSATLLFLRNVKTISIFVKEGPNSEMQLLNCVRKDSVNEPEVERSPFQHIFSSMYGNQLDGLSKDQFLQKLSKSIDRNVPWRSQKLLVSEQNSAGCRSCLWLTSECLGSFHGKNKLTTSDKKFYKFVPWACVATPINSVEIGKKMGGSEENLDESFPNTADVLQKLQASTRGTLDFDGRAFCFLPLPISTGLPVHINAYFELSSNRRDIWFGDDMAGTGRCAQTGTCTSLKRWLPQLMVIFLKELLWNLAQAIYSFPFGQKQKKSSYIKKFLWVTLIPLSSGAFAKLDKRGLSEQIYVTRAEGYSLLKDSIPHQLVDTEISDHLYHKLCALAESKDFNISFLTCQLLENILVRVIPAEWHYAKQVLWVPGNQGHPSVEWVRLLWSYLRSSCEDLSLFSNWPILPVENNHLIQLVENSKVIRDVLNSNGFLNALLAVTGKLDDIEGLFGDATDGGLHELRSFILQSKWFSDGLMDSTHVNIIKHIPMFESFKSRKLVSLSRSLKWLKPESVRDDLLDDDFVKLDSEKERIILENFLGIREPSRVDFYKDYVLSRLSDFIFQEGFLLGIFCDIRSLLTEDNTCKEVFSTTPFVQAADGAWKEPFRLYDPRVPELKMFLHKEAFFPSEPFSDPEILDTLVAFGLRQTLGVAGLLDCARSVSMLYESRDSEAVILARRLLSCLNAVTLKLSYEEVSGHSADTTTSQENALPGGGGEEKLEDFWSDLRSISWCPVYSDPPVEGLPWLASAHKIAAPLSTRPQSQMWIVSSKLHVLDGECSEYLQQKLGWMEPLDLHTLSAQLVGLSKIYNETRLQYDTELKKQIPIIYSQLQNYVRTDDLAFLKSSLVGDNWVWIGDDFVSPDVLAFDSPVKFSPYMYVVPSELSMFQDLLLALGVRQTIADNYLDGPGLENRSTLLIPDSTGVLRGAADLVYNDAPWMETNSVVGKRFVHSSISHDLANRLGIQSLRSLSLVSKELTKDFPCMDYNKITELLESHGDYEFLLFDLLELADCCKAKKLHLIFDKREHPRQSLLQHNLAEFQGPALVAILEGASLSGDEVASLQFLPPWSLRGDTLNYGLGLLSCFSISDLPSVVSDGYLYIFDPRGVAIATPSTRLPSAKVFPLRGMPG
ncbi:UNVERIFIED_CONTAM: Sacsin [Sesamum latifolium]|uniref:Sacsin n=1 Tax=Sesamum latifolium TaxID=2727402 RepID=A0AAW2U4U5_9LAMI